MLARALVLSRIVNPIEQAVRALEKVVNCLHHLRHTLLRSTSVSGSKMVAPSLVFE